VASDRPYTLSYARQFDVTSATGLEYEISVGFPMSYGITERTYPAIYVLDGNSWFGAVLDMTRSRGSMGEIGEVVVVGIGYPSGHELSVQTPRRTYDFTTSEWDSSSLLWREAARTFEAIGAELRIGGAPAFLDFIADELQPLVEARYRVDGSDRAIFGHSAGGNFAAHALFRRTDRFSKYLIACPGFAFNDWDAFRLEEEYAAAHSDLPVTVYLAAGSDEALQFSKASLVSGTARMAETLHERKYPGLKLTCEFLPGKTHETAVTEILQRGLETCWPGSPYDWSADRVRENRRAMQR